MVTREHWRPQNEALPLTLLETTFTPTDDSEHWHATNLQPERFSSLSNWPVLSTIHFEKKLGNHFLNIYLKNKQLSLGVDLMPNFDLF